jgi:hypothetical protein
MRVYHRCTTETEFHSVAGSTTAFLNFDSVESWREIETSGNSAKQSTEWTLNLWVQGSSPWRVTNNPKRLDPGGRYSLAYLREAGEPDAAAGTPRFAVELRPADEP